MAEVKEPIIEDYSPESWEYAKSYANVLGVVPSSFTSVIRSLMQEHSAGLSNTAGKSKYFVERLLKSPSLLSPFHYAAKALGKENLGKTPIANVLQVFNPYELAAILSLVYLSRRSKSLCDPEEYKYISEPMYENSLVGLAIGRIIPSIGGAAGLIEGTLRYISLATILKHDLKGFKEYRREIKKTGDGWRTDIESQRWGCSSIQIGSVFLQSLGFGITRSNAYVNAYRSKYDVGTAEEISFARDLRMATLWRESLITTANKPEIGLSAKYYPTVADLNQVLPIVHSAKKDPSICAWLERGKDDLAIENTKLQISDGEKGSAEVDALADQAAQAMEELDN